jgi:16S rRNA (cytosine1402-N4)-methyltransferase
MEYFHQPVLVKEVVELLDPQADQNVIDATVGGGGHAEALLERIAPKGRLLGLDRDPLAIIASAKRLNKFKDRILLICESYKNINKIIYEQGHFVRYDHVLLDLGISSAQVAPEEGRGFSFRSNGRLDMRFGPETQLEAQEIINYWSEQDLARIFKEYGEERHSNLIAKNIVSYRKNKKFETADELADFISLTIKHKPGKIHPATRIFQALRITVNDELETLKQSLPEILKILPAGGRLAVISYHSLEDRLVKNLFRQEAIDCICPKEIPVCRCNHRASLKIVTKKAVKPSFEEINDNPRSRSAKLRVIKKIS